MIIRKTFLNKKSKKRWYLQKNNLKRKKELKSFIFCWDLFYTTCKILNDKIIKIRKKIINETHKIERKEKEKNYGVSFRCDYI